LPSTRTGRIEVDQLTPATPVALLPLAATIPLTCVPCQELLPTRHPAKNPDAASAVVIQSPGSDASLSVPFPSLPMRESLMKSYPGSIRVSISVCVV
jgi:hypothetical protein